jgi:hypothetical protein
MVVQITTDFLPVPQVQSALYPGVSCLHLLCSRYGTEAGFHVATMQRQGSCHSNRLVGVDSSWDDPS